MSFPARLNIHLGRALKDADASALSEPVSVQEKIEKLVALAQRSDADAFAQIYDHFIDAIYRYVFFRVNADDAEDLTELIFLKTWENIGQYSRGEKSFSAWIFRIAHNIVVDHYRMQKHSTEELTENIVDTRPGSSTLDRVHRSLNREVISLALHEIKDEYRQILVLKYINDLSNNEIQTILGRSQAALRILQFRALRQLKKILEKRGITEFN